MTVLVKGGIKYNLAGVLGLENLMKGEVHDQ